MTSNIADKTLLWLIDGGSSSIYVLVPKKRGTGYLKQPYGHRSNAALDDAINRVKDCDVFGLDGYLEICANVDEDENKVLAVAMMDSLSTYYQFPHREVSRVEFFETWQM